MTDPLAAIGASAGINPDGDGVRAFRMDWDGETWNARHIIGTTEIHLTRTCTGCWAKGSGYTGMWNASRHLVEATVGYDEIVSRSEAADRLDSNGLIDEGARLRTRGARIVDTRRETVTWLADLIHAARAMAG